MIGFLIKFQLCYYDCSCDDRTKRKIVLALVDAGKEKRSPKLISGDLYPEMAPQVGLEPTTLRLTAECSAIELLRNTVAHGHKSSAVRERLL